MKLKNKPTHTDRIIKDPQETTLPIRADMSGRHKSLPSRRPGVTFDASIDTEPDDSLTIVTPQSKGYLSAHRDYAQKHFPGRVLWRMNHMSWINKHGVRVVMTRWHTQDFRWETGQDDD